MTKYVILLQFIRTKEMIAPYLTSMWDHAYGCANHYRCASAIYILQCIALEISIIIGIAVGAPGHEKYVVYDMNTRDKRMIKFKMTNLLNP